MAQVLVTGGAGFIGSHLAHALVRRGDTVRVLDNLSTGTRDNLAEIKGDVEFVQADLIDLAKVEESLQGVEIVFHEAAFVSVPGSLEDPKACFSSNVEGTINLLESARRAGISRIVLASSAAVYGANEKVPLSETDATELLSPYATSKLINEALARFYSATFNLPTVALRYFNVYGPRQSPKSAYAAAIPKFISSLAAKKAPTVFGDGSQTRDFVNVEDVVQANLRAATAKTDPGQVFNVCSGQETSLLELLEILSALYPDAPAPVFADQRLGDVQRSVGDGRRAAESLGFRAEIGLAEGLKRIVESSN